MKNMEVFLSMLKELENDYWLFMHRTDKDNIESIFNNGFMYDFSFSKTADTIIAEKDYIDFWLRARKRYGNEMIIFAIPKIVIQFNDSLASDIGFNSSNVDLLSEETDDEDFDYILSPEFIYGSISLTNGEVKKNKLFADSVVLISNRKAEEQ